MVTKKPRNDEDTGLLDLAGEYLDELGDKDSKKLDLATKAAGLLPNAKVATVLGRELTAATEETAHGEKFHQSLSELCEAEDEVRDFFEGQFGKTVKAITPEDWQKFAKHTRHHGLEAEQEEKRQQVSDTSNEYVIGAVGSLVGSGLTIAATGAAGLPALAVGGIGALGGGAAAVKGFRHFKPSKELVDSLELLNVGYAVRQECREQSDNPHKEILDSTVVSGVLAMRCDEKASAQIQAELNKLRTAEEKEAGKDLTLKDAIKEHFEQIAAAQGAPVESRLSQVMRKKDIDALIREALGEKTVSSQKEMIGSKYVRAMRQDPEGITLVSLMLGEREDLCGCVDQALEMDKMERLAFKADKIEQSPSAVQAAKEAFARHGVTAAPVAGGALPPAMLNNAKRGKDATDVTHASIV